MKFTLPELKFSKEALEPYIDAMTMEIHHQKHHGTYINNLNAALEGKDEFKDWSIEQILKNLDEETRFGPSTGSIIHAALARQIPVSRLTEGSLVQLGWGSSSWAMWSSW